MAILYQLHEGDFEKSVAEAEAVINIVPYDALAHADLGYFLANAGRTDRAVEWLETALRQEANPMDWYFGNLAVAYYLDNRPADAVAQFQKMKSPFNINFAASYVRLGKIDEARKKMAEFLQKNPKWTIKNESMWPTTRQPQMIGPLLKGYLNDLAKAGLPEH